eukprot:1903666-Pyramimonas_sp.AAC.1
MVIRDSELTGVGNLPPNPYRPELPWTLTSRNNRQGVTDFTGGNRAHLLTQRLFAQWGQARSLALNGL